MATRPLPADLDAIDAANERLFHLAPLRPLQRQAIECSLSGRDMSKAQLSGIEMLDFTGISAPSVRDMEQLGRCLNLCENLKTCDLSSVGLADDACSTACPPRAQSR